MLNDCYVTVRLLQCDRTVSLNELFHQLLHEPKKLAIIGSGCSVATEPSAETVHFYNITQVSFVESLVNNVGSRNH